MSTPLQLEDYYLTKLQINWRQPTKESVEIAETGTGFDYDVFTHVSDKKRYRMDLRVAVAERGTEEKNVGYVISADISGVFILPPETDKAACEKIVRVNGVSMLYSTLRGIIGGMSGLFPGARLVLPAIMPGEVVKQIEARKREAKQQKETVAPALSAKTDKT